MSRGSITHEPQCLLPLVGKTKFLEVDVYGAVRATDKIKTPIDTYGVPNRILLMRKVLGSVAMRHIWTGDYDLHHVAWPRAAYAESADGPELGIDYRNAPSLRITMPRQLHDYIHLVTTETAPPSTDVMRQYSLEHGQVGRLYDTVKSYKTDEEIEKFGFSEAVSMAARLDSYHRKIELMQDGEIGIMPDREYLYNLDILEARRVLRSIARSNGFSNAKQSQRAFFAVEMAA